MLYLYVYIYITEYYICILYMIVYDISKCGSLKPLISSGCLKIACMRQLHKHTEFACRSLVRPYLEHHR